MKYIVPFLIIVPAFEIGLLILSGNTLGVWPTILLIILTGVVGAWLAKREGLQTLQLAQMRMQSGELPSEAIMDGICILVGGVVLLTPGFITDALGFALLLPLSRGVIKIWLKKIIQRMIDNGQIYVTRRF